MIPATTDLACAVGVGYLLGLVFGYAACALLRPPRPKVGVNPADEGEAMRGEGAWDR